MAYNPKDVKGDVSYVPAPELQPFGKPGRVVSRLKSFADTAKYELKLNDKKLMAPPPTNPKTMSLNKRQFYIEWIDMLEKPNKIHKATISTINLRNVINKVSASGKLMLIYIRQESDGKVILNKTGSPDLLRQSIGRA